MSDDMIKIAQEYDSAGRLMARGFVDEFNKLAHNLELDKEAQPANTPPASIRRRRQSYGPPDPRKVSSGYKSTGRFNMERAANPGQSTTLKKQGMARELQQGRAAMMGTGTGKGMCKGCGKPSRKCTCR